MVNGEGDESSVSTISKSHDLSDSQSGSMHASTGEEVRQLFISLVFALQ